MRLICYAALALALALPGETRAQQREPIASNLFAIEPGANPVGFQLLDEQDHWRVVSSGIGSTAHSRPIRIYLWYPASGAGPSMRFGRYAALAADDIWPAAVAGGLRDNLKYSRQPLARPLGPAAFEALLRRPVLAVEHAKPANTRFPLIVIGEGIYFESPLRSRRRHSSGQPLPSSRSIDKTSRPRCAIWSSSSRTRAASVNDSSRTRFWRSSVGAAR